MGAREGAWKQKSTAARGGGFLGVAYVRGKDGKVTFQVKQIRDKIVAKGGFFGGSVATGCQIDHSGGNRDLSSAWIESGRQHG